MADKYIHIPGECLSQIPNYSNPSCFRKKIWQDAITTYGFYVAVFLLCIEMAVAFHTGTGGIALPINKRLPSFETAHNYSDAACTLGYTYIVPKN